MSEQQLLELNAWIAENVFGWQRQNFDNGHTKHNGLVKAKFRADRYRKHGWIKGQVFINTFPDYTTAPAAAMEVLKKCLDDQSKLQSGDPFISKDGSSYWIRTVQTNRHIEGVSETLELAICLFAKRLFTK